MIGYAFTGSFCTLSRSLSVLMRLCEEGYRIQPIMSEAVYSTDTRFFKAEDFKRRVEDITKMPIIHTVADAEPLGPKCPLDALVIAPCTGNTLAKLANGITDTAVTMAAKAHLRSDRRLLIALASNDATSANLENIGRLLMRKSVYMLPMIEDDPINKPHSLVAEIERLPEALGLMMNEGRQMTPIFSHRQLNN